MATLFYKLVLTPGLPFHQNDPFLSFKKKKSNCSAIILARANFVIRVSISLWFFEGHLLINFDLISNAMEILK